mmetsp:Transcript_275/g.672  ORF Transcript_275/g.672 Transcript_275/m.672 type:complete len:85 (-) Transcript_275:472-726(-)
MHPINDKISSTSPSHSFNEILHANSKENDRPAFKPMQRNSIGRTIAWSAQIFRSYGSSLSTSFSQGFQARRFRSSWKWQDRMLP